MKYRLDTFPDTEQLVDALTGPIGDDSYAGCCDVVDLCVQWKVGLEAELRMRMQIADERCREYGECVDGGYEAGIYDLIKELLGEVDPTDAAES